MKNFKGQLPLFLTALIWGTAYIAQKDAMNDLGPLAFNGTRLLLAAAALVPLLLIRRSTPDREAIKGGLACGAVLFFASNFQQVGVCYTTVGHTGFITALYVVLVPLLGLLAGKRIRAVTALCVTAAVLGLYLLCVPPEGFGNVNGGDILVFCSALCYALHILVIGHFSPKMDGVLLSCLQFATAGVLSLLFLPLLDLPLGFSLPTGTALSASAFNIFYTGVISGACGYTLQILGQRDTEPVISSLVLSLESVIALVAGILLLHESITLREGLGCLIVFATVVVSCLPQGEAVE